MSTSNLYRYSSLMSSHTRSWQNIYETMLFCKMNQKPRIERKINVSRLQTMQFWKYLKWCLYLLFARSLRWPLSFLQLYFVVWWNHFTSSWNDCVEFPTDSGIFKNCFGQSCQRNYWSRLSPKNIIREIYSDARRGLVRSFYLSMFLLITNQFGSVQKMNPHKGREKLHHLWR
jgi:hypothetical protein